MVQLILFLFLLFSIRDKSQLRADANVTFYDGSPVVFSERDGTIRGPPDFIIIGEQKCGTGEKPSSDIDENLRFMDNL